MMRTEMYVKNFLRYQAEMARVAQKPHFADYNWFRFPSSAPVCWIAYDMMITEYSRGISNTLNALGNYSLRLLAWHAALNDVSEDERLALIFEFVDPIAVLALSLPQVVKARFIFAITHLSHQANRGILREKWNDDLPADKDITMKLAKKYAGDWSSFAALESALENLFSNDHVIATDNFRNKYQHRFPPQELAGYSGFIHRQIKTNGDKHSVNYHFGELPPADLSKFGTELRAEYLRGLVVLDRFKLLINEQLEIIRNDRTGP